MDKPSSRSIILGALRALASEDLATADQIRRERLAESWRMVGRCAYAQELERPAPATPPRTPGRCASARPGSSLRWLAGIAAGLVLAAAVRRSTPAGECE